MKKLIPFAVFILTLALHLTAHAQDEDKSKRSSPPATVSQKLNSGATISIQYSRPSIKKRTIGKDVEPMENQVWRTGANEATVFETDKAVSIDGAKLPAGKYGLFTIFAGDQVTFIFNKTWNQWGAFSYKEEDDQLRVKTKLTKGNAASEQLTFKIDKEGVVTLLWGDRKASFTVK